MRSAAARVLADENPFIESVRSDDGVDVATGRLSLSMISLSVAETLANVVFWSSCFNNIPADVVTVTAAINIPRISITGDFDRSICCSGQILKMSSDVGRDFRSGRGLETRPTRIKCHRKSAGTRRHFQNAKHRQNHAAFPQISG